METVQRNVTAEAFFMRAGPDAEDELWRMLLKLAGSVARRRGLTREDAEDCAAEFATRMLARRAGAADHRSDGRCFPAWLRRCAENHVADFCRAKARLEQRERPWPVMLHGDGPATAWDYADPASPAEARLLREEFWRRVTAALTRLPPIMSELLVRHHLHGECIRELAASCGRSPGAVELILFRARRRMRALLERMGLTEGEMRAYIVASIPLQTHCLRCSDHKDAGEPRS